MIQVFRAKCDGFMDRAYISDVGMVDYISNSVVLHTKDGIWYDYKKEVVYFTADQYAMVRGYIVGDVAPLEAHPTRVGYIIIQP